MLYKRMVMRSDVMKLERLERPGSCGRITLTDSVEVVEFQAPNYLRFPGGWPEDLNLPDARGLAQADLLAERIRAKAAARSNCAVDLPRPTVLFHHQCDPRADSRA